MELIRGSYLSPSNPRALVTFSLPTFDNSYFKLYLSTIPQLLIICLPSLCSQIATKAMTSQVPASESSQVLGGSQHRAWWKEASVYQIYPASFCDSTGNGIGDIPGIISKLDYIKKLGVDVVWLCPIFASPQIDMGYDISDYQTIDPQYGSIADVDRLMNGLHERGIKLLLDLVVNHTSDQHKWFKQSRSGKDNPYRNWYIWRKPTYDKNGLRQPPNNWVSHFEGEFTPFSLPSTYRRLPS